MYYLTVLLQGNKATCLLALFVLCFEVWRSQSGNLSLHQTTEQSTPCWLLFVWLVVWLFFFSVWPIPKKTHSLITVQKNLSQKESNKKIKFIKEHRSIDDFPNIDFYLFCLQISWTQKPCPQPEGMKLSWRMLIQGYLFVVVLCKLKSPDQTWHQSEWKKLVQVIRHGGQHPRNNSDGVFLPAGACYRHVGFFQVQKKTEEKCSYWNGDGPAG